MLLAIVAPAAGATLVGDWAFDEGAGQIAHDSSPSGIDGHLGLTAGADSADPAWVPGVAGWGLRFDGQDTVVLPDSAALEPASLTIEAWVRRLGTPGAYAYVLSKGSRACDFSSYGLYTGAGGGIAFYVSDGSGYVVSPAATPAKVWDGRWHHVAGTFDRRSERLYLDGIEVAHGTANDHPIQYGLQSKSPYIGSYGGSCRLGFTGDIDEVQVWNSSLTAAQMAVAGRTPPAPPLGAGGVPVAPLPAAPVSGPPTLSGPRPASAPGCKVRASRRSLRAGRRNRLVITVRRNRRALHRVRVRISGRTLRLVRRTDRTGRARFVIRPSGGERPLGARALGSASSCAAATIAVRR